MFAPVQNVFPSGTNPINAFSAARKRLNPQTQLLSELCADETADAVGLPSGHRHDGFDRGPGRFPKQRDDTRGLGSISDCGRFRLNRSKFLRLGPYAPNSGFSVSKLGYALNPRHPVPNLHQASGRPLGGKFGQLLFAGELLSPTAERS